VKVSASESLKSSMRRHGGAANRADRVMEDLQKAKSWSVDQMFGAAKKRPQSAPAPVVAAAPAQAAAPVSEPATSSKLEWEWEATTVQCQMARLKVYREEDHMSTIDLSVKTGYIVGRCGSSELLLFKLILFFCAGRKSCVILSSTTYPCRESTQL